MATDRLVIGFIDDDPAELQAFAAVFGDDFTVLTGTTPADMLAELDRRGLRANLFVLDLYFASGRASTDAERNRMVELKAAVDRAQQALDDYLASLGQGPAGGLAVLGELQSTYRPTPAVFYTRKGTLRDAAACFDAGALAVLQKPAPAAFDRTQDRAAQLAEAARSQREVLASRLRARAGGSGFPGKVRRALRWLREHWAAL